MLEESLRTFRELGLRRGEAQVLGYLAEKPEAEGDLERAVELTVESATIAHEVGWTWWEADALATAAMLEEQRGNLEVAEDRARSAIDLYARLDSRRSMVFTAARLAVLAVARDQAERAGQLWGAIESDQSLDPVQGWEKKRAQVEPLVLRADGGSFARARAQGRLLSIAQAAGPPGRLG
jgi:hypothetical protein